MSKSRRIWIETGYKCFAWHGPDGVKIDALASHIGKSRSGFYNTFGDFDNFELALFEHHAEQTRQFAEEGNNITNFYPEYAELMIQYRDWLFFHKHMFLLRLSVDKYNIQFKMARELSEDKFLEIWLKTANLTGVPHEKIKHFSYIMRETIFLRLQYETFTAEVLKEELEKINRSFHALLK